MTFLTTSEQVLGAHQIEIINAQIFEEILHRLPKVKTLKVCVNVHFMIVFS